MTKLVVLILLPVLIFSCETPKTNTDENGEDELKSLEIGRQINDEAMFEDVIYVPIYSDIYADEEHQKVLLSATLSIRNTSHKDSIFVSKIDYFNTHGDLVKSYIENTISLPPMATLNYVIEKDDDTGGTGANFIVALSSKNRNTRPLIQAIMIGQNGNKGFSFSTDGYSLNK